jgi:hypothetical protein
VQSFAVALTAADSDAQLDALGELMFQVWNSPLTCLKHIYGSSDIEAAYPYIYLDYYIPFLIQMRDDILECYNLILHELYEI